MYKYGKQYNILNVGCVILSYIVNLLRIRKERGLTLRQLESMTGVSKTHLQRIEKYEDVPSVIIATKIAKALNCKIEELFEIIND